MRRRLHLRLFLWTLTGVVAAGVTVHVIHTLQMRRNAGMMLRQADKAIEQKQLPQALTYLTHYLAYQPADAEAQVKKAEVQAGLARSGADKVQALLALEQVLRQQPGRVPLHRLAADLARQLGRYPDALRHLQALSAADPKDAGLEFEAAQCLEAAGDHAAAAAALRRAVAKDPAHLESHARLAYLLTQHLDQAGEVPALLDALVAGHPHLAGAFLLRARHHRGAGRDDLAATDLGRARELAPKDAEVLLASAELALAQGQGDQARAWLEQGLAVNPEGVRWYRALAALEQDGGRPAAALACLRRGLAQSPKSVELLYFLIDVLLDEGRAAEAASELARLRALGTSPLAADYLEARLLMCRREWADAAGRLERLRAPLAHQADWLGQVDLRLGRCDAELGDGEQYVAASRRAAAGQPGNARARLGLACALVRTGQAQAALAEFDQAAQALAPPAELWAWYARALVAVNAGRPPQQRDWVRVESLLQQADPDAALTAVVRAEALAGRNKLAAAEAVLREALARHPGEVLVWTALADLGLRGGDAGAARQVLTEAKAALGDVLAIRLAEIRWWAARPPAEGAEGLDRLGTEGHGALTRAEQARWLGEAALALHRLGRRDAAVAVWQRLAQEQPKDLRSRLVLFDLALKARDAKSAAALVEELQRAEGGGGLFWRACAAELLIVRGEPGDEQALAQARAHLAAVAKGHPGWPRLALLQAALEERAGRPGKALEQYQRALEAGERNPALVTHVARLLYERRLYPQARDVVKYLDESTLKTRDQADLPVRVALRTQNPQQAVRLARQAVPPAARDYRDHLWLAEVLDRAGHTAEAEEVLRRAVKQSPNIPDVWVALVRHLVGAKQVPAAEAVLAAAGAKLPADRRGLALAQCHEALGESGLAEKIYQQMLAARPDDFVVLRALAGQYARDERWAAAEAVLRKLLAADTGTPAELLPEARRALAVALTQRGTKAALGEALTLLAENERLHGKSAADQRARANALAATPGKLAAAVQAFEETLDAKGLSAEEQFWLVRLYAAQGEAAKSAELLRDLLAGAEVSGRVLAYQIGESVRQGELEEAGRYLERLERLAPRHPRTQQMRALLAAGSPS